MSVGVNKPMLTAHRYQTGESLCSRPMLTAHRYPGECWGNNPMLTTHKYQTNEY